MDRKLSILVIEDNPGDVALLKDTLADVASLRLACAVTLADGVDLARREAFDAVLLDLSLPDSSGLETISRAAAALPSLPVIVMTGQADEETALQAVRRGAQDYLFKGTADRQMILRVIRYAMDRKQAELALQRAHDGLEQKVKERTAALQQALEDLREEVRQRLIAEDQRRRAESELLRAIEYEQQRLGCDLHDSLGQKLTGLSLLAESLATSLRATLSDKAAVAGQIVGLAKNSVAQVRVLAKGLNPVGLNVGGLAASLTELAQTVEAHSGISCRCCCDEGSSVEVAVQAMHLYRIAQEAVNNAVRHSRAKHIWITLGNRGATVSLEVGDDGVGMAETAEGRGMGMHTMKYRAGAMNGTLEVYSKPNVGTVVRCAVPKAIPAPNEDAP